MNSITSEDLTRETLALETAKCLKEIYLNSQRVSALHKEILEINLSFTTYIEESRKNLEGLRLDSANEAKSSQEVVNILSEKCIISSMSSTSSRNHINMNTADKNAIVNNNNTKVELQQARSFISWYRHKIDNERSTLSLYLSEDSILEWFGRTVKSRKKVTAFLKYEMQCSRHDFTSVENIERVIMRNENMQRKNGSVSPLQSPEAVEIRPNKRKLFQSRCLSPEWAEGCRPPDEPNNKQTIHNIENCLQSNTKAITRKRLFSNDETEVNSKGDGMLGRKAKRRCIEDTTITPPNNEVGQGDCLPSTSSTSDQPHDTLNAQLSKLAVECNGYIEFTRSRNSRSSDTMKWERKCKVQISYSEDPLNFGEFIIWVIRYTDETKCRRNLLAAFEEVAHEESKDN